MRKAKETLAFWLIIAGAPILATAENLGLMAVLLVAVGGLMWDNIVEAIKNN
jgi:hypothetical protein